MSRRQGVTINIVFRHWQINEPAEYIFDFCNLWAKSGRDKLLLYKKTAPNSRLSVDDLKNKLLFNGADKGKERKSVTLKSSLKSNNDVVTFYCENNSDYWKELHPDGWGKITSQIVIDLALDKIKESKAYSFNQLVEFVVKLLMSKQVYRVFVQGDSELYFSLDGVYTELQSFRNKKKEFFNLDWLTLLTKEHLEIIDKIFGGLLPFKDFCQKHNLSILEPQNVDGILIKMNTEIDNTLDYYSEVLHINRDFYSMF